MRKERDTPLEVELKLDVAPDDLDKILAHPLLRTEAADTTRTKRLHSTYFDTPDHALREAGISLRIRRNGSQRIQTIKTAQAADGVALARNEWEQEVDGDLPDFAAAEETALKPFLNVRSRAAVPRGQRIVPAPNHWDR